MKYKIVTASLALLFALTVTPVYGEGEGDVYYCADNNGNGFIYDNESNSYVRGGFKPYRFKVKINKDHKGIETAGDGILNAFYPCTSPSPERLTSLSCSRFFSMFNINTETGRYVRMTGYGYVNGDSDSIAVSFGKCDKF